MAPIDNPSGVEQRGDSYVPTRSHLGENGQILEAWAEGWNVGALTILVLIVFCNYRRRNTLHKLILVELILALGHGTFIFAPDPVYGWYLSSTATLLFISYQVHNIVSWLKIQPFLPKWGSRLFIYSLLVVQPFWAAETWSNFEYFNNLGSNANIKMRPFEFLVRDPWWIFTTWKLIHTIGNSYGFSLRELIKINARFGVMLGCMFLSIAFILADVIVTLKSLSKDSGINPYWRLALVFKCAADCFFLDDFKTVLDQISHQSLSRVAQGGDRGGSNGRTNHSTSVHPLDSVTATVEAPAQQLSGKWRWTRRLSSTSARRDNSIMVQREMTIITEPKRPHSFSSDVPLMQKPAKSSCRDDEAFLSPSSRLSPVTAPRHTHAPGGVQRGS